MSSSGASQYMTLCACIVPISKHDTILESLENVQKTIGATSLHTNKLRHSQKVYCAREISKQRLRLIGVASNKMTLGDYAPEIEKSSVKYYNKCVSYLLEKVCGFLIEMKIEADDVSIIFEERNHDYSALISYVSKIRNNPMHTEAKKLNAINPFSITFEKKKAEPLFFIPDFGAHALYQCFNRSPQNFGIPETRYLHELRNVFHRHEKTLKIDGYGIKYIQNINQLHADPDVSAFLKNLSVPKPSKF